MKKVIFSALFLVALAGCVAAPPQGAHRGQPQGHYEQGQRGAETAEEIFLRNLPPPPSVNGTEMVLRAAHLGPDAGRCEAPRRLVPDYNQSKPIEGGGVRTKLICR